MEKRKEKHDWLLCLLLAIIAILILVIGGGLYYFLVIDNIDNNSNINQQIVEINEYDYTGEWSVVKAIKKDEEVHLSEIYGSSASYGTGKLTLNNDGTFTDFIRPITSDEVPYKGVYSVSDKKDTIVLSYENSNQQRELIYNKSDNTLRYIEWEDYGVILSKKSDVINNTTPTVTEKTTYPESSISKTNPTNTPATNPIETPTQNNNDKISNEFWSHFENQSKIGLYEKNGAWDSYCAPGIEIRYPKNWNIEELGGYYRGTNQGKISTIIKGKVKGTAISDDREVISHVVIKIYEQEYIEGKTSEEYAKMKGNQRNIQTMWAIGLEGDNMKWTGYSGNELINQTIWTTYINNWGYEIDIETDNRDNIQLTNIENNILGTAKEISY